MESCLWAGLAVETCIPELSWWTCMTVGSYTTSHLHVATCFLFGCNIKRGLFPCEDRLFPAELSSAIAQLVFKSEWATSEWQIFYSLVWHFSTLLYHTRSTRVYNQTVTVLLYWSFRPNDGEHQYRLLHHSSVAVQHVSGSTHVPNMCRRSRYLLVLLWCNQRSIFWTKHSAHAEKSILSHARIESNSLWCIYESTCGANAQY